MIFDDTLFEQDFGFNSPGNTQAPQQAPVDELEPIKKLAIINLFYKLFLSLNVSLNPEHNRIATLVDTILKFSDVLSYDTLVQLLDRVVAYLAKTSSDSSDSKDSSEQ